MHSPSEVNTRARRKHCFSIFFPLVGKPTSCRNTTRLFLMLKTVMYPQRYHIRVSVIPILVTMEELAVKQLQASLANVRQITRDLSVKVRKIMLFVNHSLKNDKLCLSVSLRASLGEHFGKSRVSGTRDETRKTTFSRGLRRLQNLSSVWNFVLKFVLGATDSEHNTLARSIRWFDFT